MAVGQFGNEIGNFGIKNNDNGHPFSFSAIINGYTNQNLKKHDIKTY